MTLKYLGDDLTVDVTFKDATNVPADPANVVLTLTRPNGAQVVVKYPHADPFPDFTHTPGSGRFVFVQLADQTGTWVVVEQGSGNIDKIFRTEFTVRDPNIL